MSATGPSGPLVLFDCEFRVRESSCDELVVLEIGTNKYHLEHSK